jgi:SP family general alpha glucoside:H+ symporter-like MFS transporter
MASNGLRNLSVVGFPWGVIQTLAATYAAEVVPSTLRAILLSNVNMCWLIGQFAAMGVLRIFVDDETEWSYRLPFAIQWAIAVPLIIGVCFCPNSPCKCPVYDAALQRLY